MLTAPPPAPPPALGANLAWQGNPGCTIDGYGLVARYADPGVRAAVRGDLLAMHAAGLDALRTIVWHVRDPTGEAYGIVPSTGGVLPEPYRSNLEQYAADVRDAGFASLEVSFAPRFANHPGLRVYDPTRLEENWGFVQDVRALVQGSGPPTTTFDLLNEGAPSDDQPGQVIRQRTAYLEELWRRYAATFGVDDVTVSVNAGLFPPAARASPG